MDNKDCSRKASIYQQIYEAVRLTPAGYVSTYGFIDKLVGGCTPRMVGYAMAAAPDNSDIPWHRIINSQGKISPRTNGDGEFVQRILLEEEGIQFNDSGKVDLKKYLWDGISRCSNRSSSAAERL